MPYSVLYISAHHLSTLESSLLGPGCLNSPQNTFLALFICLFIFVQIKMQKIKIKMQVAHQSLRCAFICNVSFVIYSPHSYFSLFDRVAFPFNSHDALAL